MRATTQHPSRPSVIRPLLHAAAASGISVAIAVSVGIDREGWWMVPLFIGSAIAALLIWRGYDWPDDWSNYLSFGGAVLLALIANRFLYLADFFVSGEQFSEGLFFSKAPAWATFKAEIITVVGSLITVSAWLFAGGAKHSPRLMLNVPRSFLIRALVVIYVLSVLGLAVSRLSPGSEEALGQLLPTLYGLGIACTFYLPIALSRTRLFTLGMSVLLSLPFIFSSLIRGMKEDIIISLIPIAYVVWLTIPNVRARLALVTGALLIVSVITPFVGYYRDQAWLGERELTQQQALGEFADILRTQNVNDTVTSGLQVFLSRGNASAYRGLAVALADEHGYEPELIFGPMLYVFVPRVLWPEKPLIQQGWEFSGLVFGQDYMSESGSSMSAGLYPAFYLGYGWPAVLAGAAGIGILVAGLFKFASRIGGSFLVGLYSFSLLPFALRLDEGWTVGAMAGPILSFVYVTGVYLLVRPISSKKSKLDEIYLDSHQSAQ